MGSKTCNAVGICGCDMQPECQAGGRAEVVGFDAGCIAPAASRRELHEPQKLLRAGPSVKVAVARLLAAGQEDMQC
jgi:hypothetical protein